MQCEFYFEDGSAGTSLTVQWLRLRTPNAGGMGSNPGAGTKTLHAVRRGQKQKQNNKKGSANMKIQCMQKIKRHVTRLNMYNSGFSVYIKNLNLKMITILQITKLEIRSTFTSELQTYKTKRRIHTCRENM